MFVVEPAHALLARVYKEVEGNSRGVVKKPYPIKVSYGVVPLLQVLDYFEWDREVRLRAILCELTFEGLQIFIKDLS
jgi:hypothetical protein